MAELKCGAENCTYNDANYCCRGDILVGGSRACSCDDTCCDSFVPRREGREKFTSSIAHPSRTISIDCEAATCVYNSNYKCEADHVDIRGGGACSCGETSCATFTERG